jgi:hypothetical protein
MKKPFSILLLFVLVLAGSLLAQEKEVLFTPAEMTSMLTLFNQAPIKGSDVEVIAPLSIKLRNSYEIMQRDSSRHNISMKLSPQDVQICLTVLNNSTIEARFAELVLMMKQKLNALLTPEATVVKPPAGSKK